MRYSRLIVIMAIVGLLVAVGAMPAAAQTGLVNWWNANVQNGTFPGYDIQHQQSWANHCPEDFELSLEIAGLANQNALYWYDTSNVSNNGLVFAGGSSPVSTVTLAPNPSLPAHFGLMLQSNFYGHRGSYSGNIGMTNYIWNWYTEDARNEPSYGYGDNYAGTGPGGNTPAYDGNLGTAGRHALVYDLHQLSQAGAFGAAGDKPANWGERRWDYGAWVICLDDWAGDDANDPHNDPWGWRGSFDDQVIVMAKTPELPPSALLMLSSLPLGVAYIRGRRRKDE